LRHREDEKGKGGVVIKASSSTIRRGTLEILGRLVIFKKKKGKDREGLTGSNSFKAAYSLIARKERRERKKGVLRDIPYLPVPAQEEGKNASSRWNVGSDQEKLGKKEKLQRLSLYQGPGGKGNAFFYKSTCSPTLRRKEKGKESKEDRYDDPPVIQ